MKTKVFHDGFEGHVRRSIERATKRENGKRLEAEKIITFADPLDMMECLTAQRVRICQVVRTKRLSISGLAAELGRNPGHGVVQIVEPVAQRFQMRVAL